jgi:class 3 adenylate cyclase/tetratricopeptide (TPR) repeat protein
MCGTPLDEVPRPQAEERKTVTVLFCDLVGFTARSDRADPEDVRATLRPYHTRLRKEIERFGGTVEKFIGDAVMAVFGAPVAHEDDAERAVRSALRITRSIEELNEEHRELDLAVRVGIDTGEAVVALSARPQEGEGIVTGDVVNTASRLQGVAPIGGIVVGEATYRSTKDVFEYEELDAVQVKGKAEPIPIWRALAARSRFGVEVDQKTTTPLVGRAYELEMLKNTYLRALRESSVQLVTVTGEPGVGKTRLLAEFSLFVDEQPEIVYWRQGRCLPYGDGITFWALGEVVKAHAGIFESDGPEEARAKIARTVATLVEDPTDADWIQARLAPLVGAETDADGSVDREETFAAWRRFLEGVAGQRPLVVVFEDLHWADDAMLEFIEHLVDWSTGFPLLVVCTARPELFERRTGWGGGKRNSTTIALAPLTEEETSILFSALLSDAMLPPDTQTALLERAGGNPLYAEEFVRMLMDRGILERRNGEVAISHDAEFPLPDSVQALIAARLDTLPKERKSLLHDGAVVGKVFWSGAVASMGGLGERTVRQGLHELSRKELVRPARTSSVKDQAEYSFWHLLVRDVAYSQIPRAARAAKHRAAAEWIEAMAGDRVADQADLLAHHYGQALELARAAGDQGEVRELEPVTARFLVIAGDRALNLDVSKAESLYQQALQLLPPSELSRALVLMKAARTAEFGGRTSEAEHAYLAAIEAFRSMADERGRGEVLTFLSSFLFFRGETERAQAVAAEAVEVLERLPEGPELAEAYIQRGGRDMLAGRHEPALDSIERGLELARRMGIPRALVRGLDLRGSCRCDLGDLGGIDDLREALRLSLELGLTREAATTYVNLGDIVWFTEGPEAGLNNDRTGIQLAEARGQVQVAMWLRGESVWMLFDAGHWDELLESADGIAGWERERGAGQLTAMVLPFRAKVLARRGNLEEAASLKEDYLDLARSVRDPQILVPALGTAAFTEWQVGRKAEAVSLVAELEEATRETPALFRSWELPDVVRILEDAGEVALTDRFLEGLQAPTARERYVVLTARAVRAEARGKVEEALAMYHEAAGSWGMFGHLLEHGQTLLGAGRCLLALGQSAGAGLRLEEAREVFAGLGATLQIEETDAVVARLRR